MGRWPLQDAASMNAFYGSPDADHNGIPDRAWEDANLVGIVPPYGMVLAWDTTKPVKTIRVHRNAAESLLRVLTSIGQHYGTQEAIENARMHLFGGVYAFRLMRGGVALSIHSWAAAIDLDPKNNPLGVPHDPNPRRRMMPLPVVALFEAEGWTWGGGWHRADCQHFQAADV